MLHFDLPKLVELVFLIVDALKDYFGRCLVLRQLLPLKVLELLFNVQFNVLHLKCLNII